jgi:hypothetical protein
MLHDGGATPARLFTKLQTVVCTLVCSTPTWLTTPKNFPSHCQPCAAKAAHIQLRKPSLILHITAA